MATSTTPACPCRNHNSKNLRSIRILCARKQQVIKLTCQVSCFSSLVLNHKDFAYYITTHFICCDSKQLFVISTRRGLTFAIDVLVSYAYSCTLLNKLKRISFMNLCIYDAYQSAVHASSELVFAFLSWC